VSGAEAVFTVFALLSAVAAVLAVTSRHVVHAALWLVVALGALAGVYLALGAEVVALVQLLVYVGAVVVLVLFALMLTRAPIGVRADVDAPPAAGSPPPSPVSPWPASSAAPWCSPWATPASPPTSRAGRALPLGRAIFGGWLLPFELLSVLLLAALVAALAVSRGVGRR
jgi:NADH-quinone oxidoreductase subunit J